MNVSAPTTAETLRSTLGRLLDGLPPKQATAAVERLIASYRGRIPTDAPVLRDRSDVAAYAAYRMPATFEAVRAALDGLAEAAPQWAPGSHVDVGGGTGAATWAVDATWDGPRETTVLDWAEPALALGRELAAASTSEALRGAAWRRAVIGSGLTLPEADLVTVSYVLGELTPQARTAVVAEAARAGQAVVLIEPGTPEGYLRIREARDQLIAAGLRVAAPCPHDGTCPIEVGQDWCHFSARVSRSSLHRQVKGGSLPYEDEKFSYVAATRFPTQPAAFRITRRPQIRKGLVQLELCGPEEGDSSGLTRVNVTKRHGDLYKAARDADWGQAWPPPSSPEG
ncbi:rRNA methyltransferase [Streptomyces sp. ISL-44]|uniref:small ribosomal subunit Rsm22 family protein n=1 Tax=unclassified Streptomyces TaxID=2593676 RepID=UPI001BE93199|nr:MULTISPECIES: small ribosomal subunit Rsm22 family protein [unclassified Streptomyces]MBT2540420.1 rRNA methyltransferase [Streptomyces sp. ISL-44]MCX5014190.1 small ribosomal subunit Rsm22 family protein [Streptomyces sp. NBC_00555]UUU42248.1 small ribosomal subunit Rsm22 family protein [Streptomyces sp. NBC_00162]